MLARHSTMPGIVVKSGEAAPYMFSPAAALSHTPGTGEFTCCTRGHMINGKAIPCDKGKIAPMIWQMLQKRRQHALAFEEPLVYRFCTAFVPGVMNGLPCEDLELPQTLAAFLEEYRSDPVRAGVGLDDEPSCAWAVLR